jgi:dsDNA-binding SOS-regulon protein
MAERLARLARIEHDLTTRGLVSAHDAMVDVVNAMVEVIEAVNHQLEEQSELLSALVDQLNDQFGWTFDDLGVLDVPGPDTYEEAPT